MEKLIVAFESEKSCQRICDILKDGGVAACYPANSGGEVKRLASMLHVSTVVCGYKLKDGLAEDLFYDLPPAAVMLVVAKPAQIEELGDDIFSIPAPVSKSDLCAAVSLLFQVGRRLERALRPKRSDTENEVVEKAKRHLMERDGVTEEQAHRYMQKKSMDSGAKMLQTAILALQDRI